MDKIKASQEKQEKIFQEIKRKAAGMEEIGRAIDNYLSGLTEVINKDKDTPRNANYRGWAQRTIWNQIHRLEMKKSRLAQDIWRELTPGYEILVWFEANKPTIRNMPQQLLEAIKRLGIVVTDGSIEEQMYIVFPPGSKKSKRSNNRVTQIILPTGKVVKFKENYEPGLWDYLIL